MVSLYLKKFSLLPIGKVVSSTTKRLSLFRVPWAVFEFFEEIICSDYCLTPFAFIPFLWVLYRFYMGCLEFCPELSPDETNCSASLAMFV